MSKKGYLLLASGQLYEGTMVGAERDVMAELVFTTAMTGYLETITDPSYMGQIVIQTFPTIGNYGVIPPDFESKKPGLSGYIVREICHDPSNFRSQGALADYLKSQNVPVLTGIDTRALTRHLREHGVMRGRIVAGEATEEDLAACRAFALHGEAIAASCKAPA